MSTLAADTVAIRRLTVRAGQQRVADNLRDSLQSAEWPHAGHDSWVFIRRLQVSGAARQLPKQLLDQSRQYLTANNNSEQVMRFASLAQLLAALLADLVRGRAGFNWYWRRWADWFDLPVSRAIAGMLSEHLALLPSICARLAQRGGLATVWMSLNDSDARQLAVELAGLSGFRLPTSLEIAQLPGAEIGSAEGPRSLTRAAQAWTETLYRRPGFLTQWRTLLQALKVSDSRYQLALVLIGQEAAPLLLQQQPVAVLALLSNCVTSAQQPAAPRAVAAFSSPLLADMIPRMPQPSQAKPLPSRSPTGQTHPTQVLADAKLKSVAGIENQTPVSSKVRRYIAQDHNNVLQPSQATLAADASFADASFRAPALQQELPAEPAIESPEFAGFNTTQGGLLYLFNMLNRSELRELMLEHAEILPNGWAWLYRLGQALQLNEDDALVDFIAWQLGLADSNDLAQLPPMPARAQVLSLAERWYGKTGVWQPELLALSAQVHYSPSHIDLYAPMNAIRLPVRLAGLDINPGWLPWLGRVVSFHYD
jgi:hypothetical protein